MDLIQEGQKISLNIIKQDTVVEIIGTINEVYQVLENTLPRGVINCMIIKVLRDKGGDLPQVTYFEKVADSWISDSVLSTKDAVKYLTTIKERKSYNKKDDDFTSGNNSEIVWEEL